VKYARLSGLLLALVLAACGSGEPEDQSPSATGGGSPLLDPSLATERAPDMFRARFVTTKGDFVIKATRNWSPAGVDRLYNLIRIGYFHDTPFYRVMPGFVAQFGCHWQKKVNAAWEAAYIPVEPNRVSNMAGTLTFAARRGGRRSVHLFVNLANNAKLDEQGFPPVAIVEEGMQVVQSLYSNYREGADPKRIANEGSAYLQENYPNMDYIKKAELLPQ